jgi:hypothetical protein
MVAVRLTAVVGEDRRLNIVLPPEIPVGVVELTVKAVSSVDMEAANAKRAEVRAKLLAGGILATEQVSSPDAIPLTIAELWKLTQPPPGAKPTHEQIDEDRGER